MSASGKKLLVRVEPNADESFGGYIIRLTQLNYYDAPSSILNIAGIDPKFLYVGYSFLFKESVDLSLLSEVTGTSAIKLQSLTHPSAGRRAVNKIFGLPIHKNFIRVRYSKVCPRCLSESAYCRKVWDISPVTACPIHKISLLDKCPGCNKRISWVRNKVACCPCRYDLTGTPSVAVKESDLLPTRRIYQLCGLTDIRDIPSELSGSPALSLGLEHFLEGLYFIARQYRSDVHKHGGYFSSFDNAELHMLLTQSFAVFTDWPHNFHDLLTQIRARENNGTRFTGLMNNFGYFYRNLYLNLKSKQFDFMRDEFENHVYKNWYGSWAFSRNRLNGGSDYKKKYMSKAKAMRQLGLHQRCIERLIERGRLITKDSNSTRAGLLIETDGVTKLKLALKQALTLTEAARLLLISKRQVIDLVGHDCLEAVRGPTVDGSQAWKFTREAIDGLLCRIYERCSPKENIGSCRLINFHTTLTMFVGCNFDVGILIQAILDKKIVPLRDGQKACISRLLFRKEQIYEYARSLRQIHRGGYYCVKDLTKILGFTTYIPVLFLVRRGIIKAKKGTGVHSHEWLINQKTVDSFRSKFVLPAQLAKNLRTSGAFLSTLLMTNGVRPISGPKSDNVLPTKASL